VDRWEWAALAFGAPSLILGIATRLGLVRTGFMWYRVEHASAILKNAPFTLIPGGIGFLLMPVAVFLGNRGHTIFAAMAAVLALVALVTACWWSFRPPEWIKPKWLRAAERGDPEVARSGGWPRSRVGRLPVPVALYWAMLAGVAAVLVLREIFDWSFSVWVGVGFGLMQLAAMRPVSREEARRFYGAAQRRRRDAGDASS
jgi:hypothetical protein